jgi:predicted AlkP superfamily pyrophosphatase or phosphodiesterase
VPVVFLVLDGLPVRHMTPEITPTLHALATGDAAAWAPDGGRAVLASSTYSNHRTFATGVSPALHGVATNKPVIDGHRVRAEHVPLTVPTVFDACRAAGRSSEAILGDHNLVGVMGARAADRHFPFDAHIPEGAPLDPYGYIDDSMTVQQILAAIDRRPDLLVCQLNRPDTFGHICGPDMPEAHEQYRHADADLALIVDALQPFWADTTLMIVSDHDQEMIRVDVPTDLYAAAQAAGVPVWVSDDGTGAMVAAHPGHEADAEMWLRDLTARQATGVAGFSPVDHGRWIAWTHPGGWLAPENYAGLMNGVHGGINTLAQVSVVVGGDPRVAAFSAAFDHDVPEATDWAPAMLGLLGIALPTAAGT